MVGLSWYSFSNGAWMITSEDQPSWDADQPIMKLTDVTTFIFRTSGDILAFALAFRGLVNGSFDKVWFHYVQLWA